MLECVVDLLLGALRLEEVGTHAHTLEDLNVVVDGKDAVKIEHKVAPAMAVVMVTIVK